MAPATRGRKPIRFIMGMVKAPVATVLATEEPEMEPNRAEVTVAILAGPPRHRPVSEVASSMKNAPAPLFFQKGPEDHEGEDKGGEGIGDDSPKRLLGAVGEFQDTFDGDPVMRQFARQVWPEIQLGQEYHGQNGQGRPQGAAGGLHGHEDADNPHDLVPLIRHAHAVDCIIHILINPIAIRYRYQNYADDIPHTGDGL